MSGDDVSSPLIDLTARGVLSRAGIADAECFLDPSSQCIRDDSRHHERRAPMPWTSGHDAPPEPRCIHRHTEPVESLSGEVVARLCLHCDAQLPA